MRETKFRGKAKDKWVYGSVISGEDGVFILEAGYTIQFQEPDYHSQGMGCGLEDRNITDRYDSMSHGWEKAIERVAESYPPFVEVDADTVGEFTGLKDKNGKDIYEGDIVVTDSNGRFDIRWREGSTMSEGVIFPGFQTNGWEGGQMRVIGNIYENPELS